MKTILLIDPNTIYAEKLREKLNHALEPMAEITVAAEFVPCSNHADLLIIHESYLIMDDTYKVQIPKEYQNKVIIIFENDFQAKKIDDQNNNSYLSLSRTTKLKDWVRSILLVLAENRPSSELKQNQVQLLFTFNQKKRHIFFQKWLIEQKTYGRKIFVLPLKPLYFWNYRVNFHQGPDLSDLILQIEQDLALTEQDLGQIFEIQKDGMFVPRPGNFSEDIFAYGKQNILKTCRLFRDFILNQEKETIGLIDVEARSFTLVKEIAALCDKFHMDLVDENNFGNRRAKEEVATFLATKSPHVQFVPIDISG